MRGIARSGLPSLLKYHTGLFAQYSVAAYSNAGQCASMSTAAGGSNPYPPPDTDRGGTADLCDVFLPDPVDKICERAVQVVDNVFRDYGGRTRFSGRVTTVKCFESNPMVRKALEEDGAGRVLVVDGGASMRCALMGDTIAEMATQNGWQGVIIYGCLRDSEAIEALPLGVKALNTHPLKSSKRDPGLRDVPVTFGSTTFRPGDWLYADKDGVLVSSTELKIE